MRQPGAVARCLSGEVGGHLVSERVHRAVSFTMQSGYQLDGEAFTFLETLSKTEDPVALMEKVTKRIDEAEQKPLFITRNLIEETVTKTPDTQLETAEQLAPEPPPFFDEISSYEQRLL